MKHILLTSFLILFIAFKGYSQESADLQKLKNAVFERIKLDLKNQDTSYFLFPLKIDNIMKGPNSKTTLKDSANFTFQDGSYLRFYLTCSGAPGNIAHLRLFKISGSRTLPNILLKEISCNTNENQIVSFDYYIKDIERFNIYLTFDKDMPASAFSFGTQYFPKKSK